MTAGRRRSRVVLDMATSLDGFIATPDGRDAGLHRYFFSPSRETARVVRDGIHATGAIVMGRRAYDLGEQHGGFADDPYPVPHFVLTHRRPAVPARGAESFVFVEDGVVSALRLARAAAGSRHVVVGGGGDVARQFLRARLVDELCLHVVPRALGVGMRLFDAATPLSGLALLGAVAAPDALHLTYAVGRENEGPSPGGGATAP